MGARTHRKCRPPEGAVNVERWTGRRWIPDDGEPGYAFIGQLVQNLAPIAWFVRCDCFARSDCPARRASYRNCERHGCSNGQNMPAVGG